MASNPTGYHGLLKSLIKQAIQRLEGEHVVEVRARPVDLALAKAATQVAVGEVSAAAKAAGKVLNITATTVSDPTLESSVGGVVVSAMNGRIRCSNTLEDRLELVLHDLTPVIRDLLFPSAKAVEKTKPAIHFPHKQQHGPAPTAPAAARTSSPAPQSTTTVAVATAAAVPVAAVSSAPATTAATPAPVPVTAPVAPAPASAGGDPFAF